MGVLGLRSVMHAYSVYHTPQLRTLAQPVHAILFWNRKTMTATSSKAQTFYRRLYIAYLIDTGAAASVPAIVALTGMPRRTVQDAIKSLISMGVQCHFAGPNRTGHYVIDD